MHRFLFLAHSLQRLNLGNLLDHFCVIILILQKKKSYAISIEGISWIFSRIYYVIRLITDLLWKNQTKINVWFLMVIASKMTRNSNRKCLFFTTFFSLGYLGYFIENFFLILSVWECIQENKRKTWMFTEVIHGLSRIACLVTLFDNHAGSSWT